MSGSTFGARVVGEKAAAEALAAQKGGGEVFGKRVFNPAASPNSEQAAKGNSQFGAAVIGGAHESDARGKEGSTSVADLERILGENPTFFDSLYEAELARKEGARVDALKIFLNVEYGIKGAGRAHVIEEIRGLLGETAVTAKQRGNDLLAHGKRIEAQQERQTENANLLDAERVQGLRDRDDNLEALAKSKNKGTQSQIGSADTDAQQKAIAKDEKLDIGGDASKPGEPIVPAGVAGVVKGGAEKSAKAGDSTAATPSGTKQQPPVTGDGTASGTQKQTPSTSGKSRSSAKSSAKKKGSKK